MLEKLNLALEHLGVRRGAGLLVHSSFALAFDSELGVTPGKLLDCLEEFIGSEGVIVLPSFTYSFARGEVFDKSNSARLDQMGALSTEAFARGYFRTEDPIFSFLASERTFSGVDLEPEFQRSFGAGSTFRKLIDLNFLVLNFGMHSATTLIHEFEFESKVPYRFEKTFDGQRLRGHLREPITWTSYVRDLDSPRSEVQISKVNLAMSQLASFRCVKLGRHSSSAFLAKEAGSLVARTLKEDPLSFV